VRLARDGRRTSTHDLVDLRFTLLAGARGRPWRDAARSAAASLRVPLDALTVGPDADIEDPESQWMGRAAWKPTARCWCARTGTWRGAVRLLLSIRRIRSTPRSAQYFR
jgi:hypothetical protein